MLNAFLKRLDPLAMLESMLALWKDHVPDWLRKPINALLAAGGLIMLSWLTDFHEKISEFGAIGYIVTGLILLLLLIWISVGIRRLRAERQTTINEPSEMYMNAIRVYIKLELQPAYDAAMHQDLSIYRMPEFPLTDAVWHHYLQKLEDKTAIPGLSYGLRDNLFDTCLWYVFCTQQLRKPKPTPEPNTPLRAAWVEWQERDRNAIEKFRALSVHREHVPIDRVFKLADR